MIKVLHIIKSLGRGGAEMLLQETLKYHNKQEFEFHYLYFLPWKDQMVAGIKKNGGIINNFPAKNNIYIMLQVPKIIKYIKQNKIQLIHCHLPWAGFVGRIIYKLTGIPVVYSEHNKQERYHSITKVLNKFTFNWQTKAIAVSGDVAESIGKNIHPKIPVQTILNGVATDFFLRDEQAAKELKIKYNIDPNAFIIGTIAVFRFQKRIKEWITVFKSLEQKYPGIRGIIVGDGQLKDELLSFIKEQGMEEKIVVPGLQTEVKPWLSSMDIFMMSSLFEGLPIALLEAMSMECAVVCTDAGGIPELIRSGEDGFLVPVDEWQKLELPVSNLIENRDELNKFKFSARRRVIESFSIKNMVEETEKMYKEILSK
ncbi:MAG: glycosyltransferase [Ferruginibacter sp.]